MQKIYIAIFFTCLFALTISAQKKLKPWIEWADKDIDKILNDSAWGQTQVETDTSEMFYSPTTQGGSSSRSSQGAVNQAMSVSYRIRLLSAKPIRQAFARRTTLKNPELTEQLKAFAEQKTDKYIAVAVDYDSPDKRFSGTVMQILNSATTAKLKNNTYLETKDNERLFLSQYIAPTNDGMGAKFVFVRELNGKPFITPDSAYLRFYSELDKKITLNMRFKIKDMMYDGVLEY